MGAHKLTQTHKTHIAKRFAEFVASSAIVADLKAEYGVTVSRQRIDQLRDELKAEIREAQAQFLEDWSDVPYAFAKVRVQRLAKMREQAEEAKKAGLELQIMMAMQKETEHLQRVGANATEKEALAFLRGLSVGSTGTGSVPADTRPNNPH